MDRRSFTRLALSGLAFSVLADSMGRAESGIGATAAPPLPAKPKPLPTGPLATQPYAKLLDRAKAALDQHSHSFELRDRVALADFDSPSRELRFHIVDLLGGHTSSYLVAHGRGSDPDHSGWLHSFSNEPNSLASSAGAYKTGAIYEGQHGRAMRLAGLDAQNNNAEARAIVIHGADYVSENHIATWGKVGRSEGCFAVARHMLPQLLGLLGPGRMVYANKLSATA